MAKTTIQLSSRTLERLKDHKYFERQSYDEVLNRILDEIEEEHLGDEEIEDLHEALEQVRTGETEPIEAVARSLGVKL
ncbi:MAG: hypothetical protein ACMXYM_00265 [Candidatus Woesearchaeota archaeon]